MKREEIIEQGLRLLNDVKSDEHFKTVDGRTLRSVRELVLLLETYNDEHFRHHVNEHRNDFAAWVEHSVRDPVLADKIRSADSKERIQQAISSRLEELESQLLATQRAETPAEPEAQPTKTVAAPVAHEPQAAPKEDEDEDEEHHDLDALVDQPPENAVVERDELLEEIETAIAQAHAQLQIERAQEQRVETDLTGEPDSAPEQPAQEAKQKNGVKQKKKKTKKPDSSASGSRDASSSFSLKDFFIGFGFGTLIGGVVGALIGLMLL